MTFRLPFLYNFLCSYALMGTSNASVNAFRELLAGEKKRHRMGEYIPERKAEPVLAGRAGAPDTAQERAFFAKKKWYRAFCAFRKEGFFF